ncbi:DNA-binding NarL/FixJ family response regulator [Streptomyces sp. TLI_235]|nr:response regulator transcription factor [Streptomyces sp. TLI_235]PBC75385.1 DNA-binding NarL/FixJ family response regulator [Streptomyces sp. TLI_235]
MGEPLRVNVVALDPLPEAGVRSALHGCPDVCVVPAEEAARVTVVIVDGVTEQVLHTVRTVRAARHRPEVVLVAAELAPAEAMHAIAAGARGLLRRHEAGAARLARTVLAAAGGDCTVPPDLLDGLLEQAAGAGPPFGAPASWPGTGLSNRERDVLRLVADGRDTDEIARELSYSARTVAGVLHDITQRLRLRNRAHAVAYALRAGLL